MRMPDGAHAQPSNNSGASPAGGLQPHAPQAGSPPTVSAAAAAALLEAAVALPERADVLVTDMLDHRCSVTVHHETLCYLGCAAPVFPSTEGVASVGNDAGCHDRAS